MFTLTLTFGYIHIGGLNRALNRYNIANLEEDGNYFVRLILEFTLDEVLANSALSHVFANHSAVSLEGNFMVFSLLGMKNTSLGFFELLKPYLPKIECKVANGDGIECHAKGLSAEVLSAFCLPQLQN